MQTNNLRIYREQKSAVCVNFMYVQFVNLANSA